MALASPRFDLARFGAEAPRFSPRQSDLLWVVGTISQRQAPVLKRIYEQMMEPKWVLAFGTCASSRRLLRQLHDGPGHRQNHPVRRLHPRLPAAPRGGARRPDAPSGQDRARRAHVPASSSRAFDPVQDVDGLVKLRRSATDPREVVPALKAEEARAMAAREARSEPARPRQAAGALRRGHPGDALATSATTPRVVDPRAVEGSLHVPPRRSGARLRHARRPLRRRLPEPRRDRPHRGRAAPLLDLASGTASASRRASATRTWTARSSTASRRSGRG